MGVSPQPNSGKLDRSPEKHPERTNISKNNLGKFALFAGSLFCISFRLKEIVVFKIL
jgi:hypothetical protein